MPISEEGICRTSNLIVLCWGHVPRTFWIDRGVRVESSLFQRSWLRGAKLTIYGVNFKLDFWIQWCLSLVWYVSRIQKSHLIWMHLKVEVKSPLSALCHSSNISETESSSPLACHLHKNEKNCFFCSIFLSLLELDIQMKN